MKKSLIAVTIAVMTMVVATRLAPQLMWYLPWPVHHVICWLTGYRVVRSTSSNHTWFAWSYWPFERSDKVAQ